jgi:hypothetical protein
MLNDIQITSDYMSRWVVLKRRVGAVTSQCTWCVRLLMCDSHIYFNVRTLGPVIGQIIIL